MTVSDPTNPNAVSTLLVGFGIAAATVAAMVVSFPPALCSRPLDIDETVTHWVVDPRSPGGFWERATAYSATPPGYFVALKLWLATGANCEMGYRVPSLLCHGIAALLVGIWVHRRAGAAAALFAALLVATHPLLRAQAVMARPYAAAVLASWTGFAASYSLATKGSSGRGWTVWIISAAAVVWCHYLFVLALVPQVLLLIAGMIRRRLPVASLLAACAVSFGLSIPLLPAVMRLWMRRQYLNWTPTPAPWSSLFEMVFPWLRPSTDALQAVGAVVSGGIVLFAIVRLLSPRHRPEGAVRQVRAAALLFGLGVIPILLLWLVGHGGLPALASSRYTTPAYPILCAAVAIVLGALLPNRAIWIAAVTLCLAQGAFEHTAHWRYALGTGSSTVPIWHDPDRWTAAGWKAACAQLRNCRETDYLLVSSGLAEQTLVPVFFEDEILHDYVTCRATRFYLTGSEPRRIAVPAPWRPELRLAVERRLRAAVRAAESSGRPLPSVFLLAATDTDVLRKRANQTLSVLTAAGWQVTRHQAWNGVELFECRFSQRR